MDDDTAVIECRLLCFTNLCTLGLLAIIRQFNNASIIRSCFDLFEMFFEVKKSSFSSRFFSQIAPLSSLEEAVEPEVFHSQTSARTESNRACSDCRGEQQGKSLLLTFKQTNQNSFLSASLSTFTTISSCSGMTAMCLSSKWSLSLSKW